MIKRPFITQNETYTRILWDTPQEPNGRVEYYELKVKEKQDKENKTTILDVTGESTEFHFNDQHISKIIIDCKIRCDNLICEIFFFPS